MEIYFIKTVELTLLPQLALCFAYSSVTLGMWTLVMMLLASCSDPGIINRKEDTHSQEATMRTMSLNEDELKAFVENDPVYTRCQLY